MKPTLVVSMGDPNGIGPEILLKAFVSGKLDVPFFVVGDASVYANIDSQSHNIHIMNSVHDVFPGNLNLFDAKLLSPTDLQPGKLSKRAGAASKHYIEQAARHVLAGEADAMVTLPVSKEAVQLSSPGFTGHTELIAEYCGQTGYTMMLVSDRLTVTHVSTHVSMAQAVGAVRRDRVLEVILLTRDALLQMKGREPKVAIAGLNPHAGENGLFGQEEREEILPAVRDAQAQGVDASGPHPPDTVFFKAARGEYDAVVCMYHDQGHIPLKLLDFAGGVNVTLGLRIIRTSVDHGTAFDIAGKGVADPESFVRAFALAAEMASGKARHTNRTE